MIYLVFGYVEFDGKNLCSLFC